MMDKNKNGGGRISSESPANKLLFVSLDAFFVLNKVLKCIILKKCNK